VVGRKVITSQIGLVNQKEATPLVLNTASRRAQDSTQTQKRFVPPKPKELRNMHGRALSQKDEHGHAPLSWETFSPEDGEKVGKK
jgi:hypothetical protein